MGHAAAKRNIGKTPTIRERRLIDFDHAVREYNAGNIGAVPKRILIYVANRQTVDCAGYDQRLTNDSTQVFCDRNLAIVAYELPRSDHRRRTAAIGRIPPSGPLQMIDRKITFIEYFRIWPEARGIAKEINSFELRAKSKSTFADIGHIGRNSDIG